MTIDLLSVVNSHEKPFVIIGKDYRILAANKAYESTYGRTLDDSSGMKCYEVSHDNTRPCHQDGEECPHQHVFNTGKSCVCTHVHCDADHHLHQVKITAYPLHGAGGELLLGECIESTAAKNTVANSSMDAVNRKHMVGNTAIFKECLEQLRVAACSQASILLQGETGTGKELAAHYIHQHSERSDKPFQIIDSTVFTESLFESEMFGHVSGAYTGSTGEKQGLFELADGGTVFLDEIGDMPAIQQAKLLRVFETGEYRRVGGTRALSADVRIICATNSHLWESVLNGTFREDLYFRIACFTIRLPTLRERQDDLPILAENLLQGVNATMNHNYRLQPDAIEQLKRYDYPGNIRELRNILFIAATRSDDSNIDGKLVKSIINTLPCCKGHKHVRAHNGKQAMLDASLQAVEMRPHGSNEEPATLKEMEMQHIKSLLEQHDGNRKKVATALGISERTMYRKLKSLSALENQELFSDHN